MCPCPGTAHLETPLALEGEVDESERALMGVREDKRPDTEDDRSEKLFRMYN